MGNIYLLLVLKTTLSLSSISMFSNLHSPHFPYFLFLLRVFLSAMPSWHPLMSHPTKRFATSASTTGPSSSSSSGDGAAPSPFAPPPMKKAKSQAVAGSLDSTTAHKNGLHPHPAKQQSQQPGFDPESDVVFDPTTMSLEDGMKSDDVAAGHSVAANLSRKKATPPQPAKKLVIKLVKGIFIPRSLVDLIRAFCLGDDWASSNYWAWMDLLNFVRQVSDLLPFQ